MTSVTRSFLSKYFQAFLNTTLTKTLNESIRTLQSYRFLIIGFFACMIFGGFEFLELFFTEPQNANLQTPVGFLCNWFVRNILSNWILLDTENARLEWQYLCYLSYFALLPLLSATLLWLRVQHRGFRDNHLFSVQLIAGLLGMSALLLVLAAQFAAFLSLRRALAWLALLMLAYSGVHLYYVFSSPTLAIHHWKIGVFYLFAQLSLYGIFFAIVLALKRDIRQRQRLSVAYAELQATQVILSDTVRVTERTRIARDLHDILGHHLTALNLHLDLALRHSSLMNLETSTNSGNDNTLHQTLVVSRELARDLLTEVRAVVSSEKNDREINLQNALTILCTSIPTPIISLHFVTPDKPIPVHIAHSIFCCVREAITNAIRHANAKNMKITIKQHELKLSVQIQDDGRGCDRFIENNGLRGMQERLRLCGGEFRLDHAHNQGFYLNMLFPLNEYHT